MSTLRDPIRLLDPESGASSDLRNLLRSAEGDGPSGTDIGRLSAGLAPLVGVPQTIHSAGAVTAGVGSTAAPAVLKTFVGLKLTSLVLVGAGIGLVGGTVVTDRYLAASRRSGQHPSIGQTTRGATQPLSAAQPGVLPEVSEASPTPTPGLPTPVRIEASRPEASRPRAAGQGGSIARRVEREGSTNTATIPSPRTETAASGSAVTTKTQDGNQAPTDDTPPVPETRGATLTTAPGETELIDSAMAALQTGNPEQALSLASQHRNRYPGGSMAQEREYVAIQALVRLGRTTEARQRLELDKGEFHPFGYAWKVGPFIDASPGR